MFSESNFYVLFCFSFQDIHSFPADHGLPWGPVFKALAVCHSLIVWEGKIQGDPLDVKMFEATNWVKLCFVVVQTVGRSPCHLRFSQTPIKVMKNSGILLTNSCETGIIELPLTPKNIFVPHNHVVMIKKSRWFVEYFKSKAFYININSCVLFSYWIYVMSKDLCLFVL